MAPARRPIRPRPRAPRRRGQLPAALMLATALLLGRAPDAPAQIIFTDVSAQRGIGAYQMAQGMGAGIAAADFDDDGDIDVFVPTAQGMADQLYENDGAGNFTDIAAQRGLASTEPNRAALWFDYDGDHDLDLVVIRDACQLPCTIDLLHLYQQQPDGQFIDVTAQAALTGAVATDDNMHGGGLVAGDLNGDGYLDLYFVYWEAFSNLYLNDTNGGFINATAQSGLAANTSYWQPILHDFNGDGALDIYQLVDFVANRFWINDGNANFTDVAASVGAANAMNDMGVSLGDYDNDGDFDIYITNVTRFANHNVLYQNNSAGPSLSFAEVSQALGVDQGGWGWGTTFLDADRDGWLDIAATNGACCQWEFDESKLYLNQTGPNPTFADVSAAVQFNDTLRGSALIAFDADRDGDLDVMQTCSAGGPLRLLDNAPTTSAGNHYLVVRPRHPGPNHYAIGAVVRATVGAMTMSRLITAGTSYLSQEPAEAFFGTGTAAVVDRLDVYWPDGTVTSRFNLPTDRVMTIVPATVGVPAPVPAVAPSAPVLLLAVVLLAAIVALRPAPRP